jgi:hypothetical protein
MKMRKATSQKGIVKAVESAVVKVRVFGGIEQCLWVVRRGHARGAETSVKAFGAPGPMFRVRTGPTEKLESFHQHHTSFIRIYNI